MALPDSLTEAAAARLSLRRTLRLRRAALDGATRTAAVRRICRHLSISDWLRAGTAVGLYASVGDEVSTSTIVELAQRRCCVIYLPRIVDYRQRRMVFAPYTPGRWRRNRYGIAEPVTHCLAPAHTLRVVFLPLLGFDASGTRLGVGGGYYDRAFAFRRLWPCRRRPLLVGIAFGCQQLPHIEPGAHDVALDAVVTEDGITCFASQLRL